MKAFDREEYLARHIPYRMQSIAWFLRVLDGTWDWKEPKEMHILIDGKLCISGTHHGLTNPSIEVGIIYSRVLLEFLGLKAKKPKKALVEISDRWDDDIGIEDFSTNAGPLKKVTVSEALKCYPGDPRDAEESLVTIIAHADKAIAHMTEGLLQDERTLGLVELGGKGVLELMSRHFYGALGRKVPSFRMPTIRPSISSSGV